MHSVTGTWLNPSAGKWESLMPQKEISQSPCWWGGNTKTDGIKGHITKVYFVWVKEKSQVTNLRDNKSKITPLLGGIQASWGCPFLFLFFFHSRIKGEMLTGEFTSALRAQICQYMSFKSSLSCSLPTGGSDDRGQLSVTGELCLLHKESDSLIC